MSKKDNKKSIIFMVLLGIVVAWMVVIYAFSSMTHQESYDLSGIITNMVVEYTGVEPMDDWYDLYTDGKFDTEKYERQKYTFAVNRIVRKVAHATVFFVFSILMSIALLVKFKSPIKVYTIVILLCFAYACTDEFHQLFVDGRTAEWMDVLIDTAGATLGCILVTIVHGIVALIAKLISKKKTSKNELANS